MKYVVVLIVVLFAAHLLLSRRPPAKTAPGRSIRMALESTIRKVSIAAAVVIAAYVLVVLATHLTA